MLRKDLITLTSEDLASLGNVGLVKRAQKECEAGEPGYILNEEDDGTVTIKWTDGIECQIPARTVLAKSHCSCPATTLCRHLIRTVFVYQKEAAGRVESVEIDIEGKSAKTETGQEKRETKSAAEEKAGRENKGVWDPGNFSDQTLKEVFSKRALRQADGWFKEGQVIELYRGVRPVAHILTLSCTLRFLVEEDIRYTHCDCLEEDPCSHVPLVVVAFRLLAKERETGLIMTKEENEPIAGELLDNLDQRLGELLREGITGAPRLLREHLERLVERFEEESLIWPAEILADLRQQIERYQNHDALFDQEEVLKLVGELLVRQRALRQPRRIVPDLFLKGTKSDRSTVMGTARLIGLGCGISIKAHRIELIVYYQDLDSGLIMTIQKEIPDGDEPEIFRESGKRFGLKSYSMAALGEGQLLLKGGKRTAGYQLRPGRATVSLTAQPFAWEGLREPLLVESFAQLQAHLLTLLPPALRPRRPSSAFHVCKIQRLENLHFSLKEQAIVGICRDEDGGEAILHHPFTSRGAEGCEALLKVGTKLKDNLSFIAGQTRLQGNRIVFSPVALVFAGEGKRIMLQPWVSTLVEAENLLASLTNSHTLSPPQKETTLEIKGMLTHEEGSRETTPEESIAAYLDRVARGLSELFLNGLLRISAEVNREWQELARLGPELGFQRLGEPIIALAVQVEKKAKGYPCQEEKIRELVLELTFLIYLAREEINR